MLGIKRWFIIVGIFCMGILFGVAVAEDSPSAWVLPAPPTLTKIADLQDNIAPSPTNTDCDTITSRFINSTSATQQCVMQTPVGLAGTGGIVFNGSSEVVPVVPPYPYNGLRPIPNQEMMYTYSNAPVVGLNLHFYKTVRDKLKNTPDIINGVSQYVLTKGPEFSLRDSNGQLITVNPGAVAFSANGSWMIVDLPAQGFVRINLATFEMLPFASSMNGGGDYASYSAQLAISNDGRYAVIKPGPWTALKVYDIASCKDAVLPVDSQHPKCQSRDYWSYLDSQFMGFRAIYQPRFMNGNQLTLAIMYNYSPGSFKIAQYTLTAPGVSPAGIGYLGMGDSYASGQGAFNYILGTDTSNNTCHLSSLSYPFLLSADLFQSGHSVACSGAEAIDITNVSSSYMGQVKDHIPKGERKNMEEILWDYTPGFIAQSEFVEKYNPQLITLSIGGNDIGFADIVQRCVMPRIRNTTCYASYEDQQELVRRIQAIGDRLRSTYRTVAASGRRVYIIGYPQIVLAGGNCASNVHLNLQETQLFSDLTATLNQVIKQSAASVGAQYVDVSNAFVGHRMCEAKGEDVAVNGLTAGNDQGIKKVKFIGAESYHPNALGHWLLEQAILKQTNNLKGLPSPPPDALSPLPYSSSPKTGRAINVTVHDANLSPDIIASGVGVSMQVPLSTAMLKTLTLYSVKLDTDANPAATITTDAAGVLAGTVTVPGNTSCGPHTIHILGQGIANQPLDIFKEIYVTTGTDDCSGAASPCGVIAPSGVDIDKDGIDDACDPTISQPPAYKVYLTGSSIHIGA